MRNKKVLILIGGVVTSFLLSLFSNCLTLSVSAVSEDSIYKKTLLNAIKTCYNDTYMKKSILGTDYYNISSLFTRDGKKDGKVLVPTKYGNTLNDGDLECQEVFLGHPDNNTSKTKNNSARGLLKLYSKNAGETNLPSLGYAKQDVSTGGGYRQGCVSFKYTAPNGSGGSQQYETNQICMDVDSDNKIDVYTNAPVVKESKGGDISIFMDPNYVVSIYGPGGITATVPHSLMVGGGQDWNKFKEEFTSAAQQIDGWYDMYSATSLGLHLDSINANLGNEDHYVEYVREQSGDVAATKALRYFAGSGKTWDSIKFNDEDRYTLYTAYIERYINDSGYPAVYIGPDSKCSGKMDDAKKETGYAYRKDKTTWCPLYGVDSIYDNLNGIDSGNTKLKQMTFKDIVNEMMKSKYDQYAADKGSNPIGSADPGGDDGSGGGTQEEASPCSTASASLGWIICPVVQALSKAVDGIYGYIEDNYLQMNSSYVSNDSGTKSGWETFRNLANIVFVIVLVIIILSQITGFGVSNYGVKKMLPSLIIVAVLVNLSFFLCEIAVDISNIVGYGIKDTFEGIKVNMGSVGENGVGIGPLISSIIPTLLSGGALFAGVAIAATTWELWIMPFLLLLLVTVIGILFFFILLGMRQAGIIILIALAPVAIICYALPNTKSVFSRWWKLFSALLLVYPICGALMGGGHFASKLLLSNITASSGEGTTVFYTFVAILIQVVPFFFIPSILRSSFQAMGNLGNRLSMLGTRLGRSATGAIRRSDRYKDTQTRMAGNNAQRALRRSESERGLWGVRNRIGARMRSGNNRVSRAMDNSYNRRQARRVNAVAGRQMADQNARFIAANGLAAAERRQNDEMMKNYESNYKSDLAFMNNLDQQEQAYSDAINAVDADPTNQDSIAQLRALQNVLGSTPDGQDRIQRVLNHKLYDAQQAAPAGTAPTLSAGMQTASQTLMNDHGGFKSGNRGLNATLKDMNSGKVFNNGTFARTGTDLSGNAIYSNAHYGAQAAKGSASELANANDDTLKNLLGSVSSMNASQLASVYRNASEAITNDNISVKPENEDMLNKIRQAAYGRMQADAASSTSYHDNQGRTFTNTGGNNYEYQDATGATHSFTRDAATGNFTEVGGAGEVINSNDMMTASENFSSNYGSNYRDLHASDEFKVSHTPARRKIEMPPGWMRNAAGTWINSRDGFRNLTPDEVRRAEQYEAHNIQVDIDNDSRR